jgi:dihydroflavonol-4-reductase
MAEAATGVRAPMFTVPLAAARLWGPIGTRVARRSGNPLQATSDSLRALRFHPVVSGRKAADELGHHPRPVEETVQDLYRWFRDQGMLGRP